MQKTLTPLTHYKIWGIIPEARLAEKRDINNVKEPHHIMKCLDSELVKWIALTLQKLENAIVTERMQEKINKKSWKAVHRERVVRKRARAKRAPFHNLLSFIPKTLSLSHEDKSSEYWSSSDSSLTSSGTMYQKCASLQIEPKRGDIFQHQRVESTPHDNSSFIASNSNVCIYHQAISKSIKMCKDVSFDQIRSFIPEKSAKLF